MTKHRHAKKAEQEKPPTPAQQALEIFKQLHAGVQKGGFGAVYFTSADGRDGVFSARTAIVGLGYHAREACLYTVSHGKEGEPNYDLTQWDIPRGFIKTIQAELARGAKIKPPADPNEETQVIPLDQLPK